MQRRPGLAVAGLIGASVGLADPLTPLVGVDLTPVWFAAAVAGYFWITGREGSRAKTIGLIFTITAAYWLALLAAAGFDLAVFSNPNGFDKPREDHALSMFVGGAIGAAVASWAIVSAYAGAKAPMRTILICAVGGGLLGAAGFELGMAMPFRVRGSDPYIPILNLVWQTGIGLLVGLMWPDDDSDATEIGVEA